MRSLNEFKNDIKRYDVVSFDIFGTLVERVFDSPSDVFDAVEKKYYALYHNHLSSFKKKRIEAERKARRESKFQDVTIDEIYSLLNYKNIEKIKEIEIEVEISCSLPNTEIVELYNYCKMRNKKTIIITDMYLPRNVINKILGKCGIDSYERLYISSEEGLTKYNGDLYRVVKSEQAANSIIHIGDNEINDYNRALESGIDAFLYAKVRKESETYFDANVKNFAIGYLVNYIRKTNIYANEPCHSFGYSLLGPFVFAYCKWIHKEVSKKNISIIIFLAREGYYIKQAYEKMYGSSSDLYYFAFNDNVLFYPLLYVDSSIKSFFNNIPMKRAEYSAEYLVKILTRGADWQESDIIKILNANNVDCRILLGVNEWINNENFVNAYNEIVSLIKKEISQQYHMLLEYLYDNKLFGEKVLLVNNSMAASAQIKLNKIIRFVGKDMIICNAHIIRRRKIEEKMLAHCTWFNKGCREVNKSFFYSTCLLFEIMCFPHCGTSLFYKHSENGVRVESESDSVSEKNYETIKKVQEGATKFIGDFLDSSIFEIESKYFLDAWCSFVKNPKYCDAIIFSKITDFEDDKEKPFVKDLSYNNSIIDDVWWKQGTLVINKNINTLKRFNRTKTKEYCKRKVWE